jgi:signal transduction histidine kinase
MKPFGAVRDLRLRFWLRSMTCAAAFGLAVFACMAFLTINEVRSGSTAFAVNRIAYEISRDFTAPSQSLLAVYPFFRKSRIAHTPDDFSKLRSMLAESRAHLETAHAHYLDTMPPGHLRQLVTVDSYQSAEEWYSVAEQEYLPQVEKGNMDAAEAVRVEKLEPLFDKNSAINAQIAALADQWISANGVYVNTTVRARSLQLAAVCLLTLLVQIILGTIVDARIRSGSNRLQNTLDELQRKNTEVETFVYIVSHDLRAPLVNLQGFVREVEESCERLRQLAAAAPHTPDHLPSAHSQEILKILDGDVAGALRFIGASATKFDRLIKALLNLSRQGRQTYKWTLIDANELVAQTLATMQQQLTESGASISVNTLPQVFADEDSLCQVFSNLISNAIKYRCPDRSLHIDIGGAEESEFVHFWVKDNGLGLPESSKARIFQAFQRFHPQYADGDGMGLVLVQRIAERHGGKVWVESQEGLGSTFHISLPASPVTAPC